MTDTTHKLAPNIFVDCSFPGVTVGAIATPTGVICIDAPTHPADARRWRQKLAQLAPGPVEFIINLDHHRDRVLGNQWLEGPVLAHELTSDRVRQLPEVFKGGPSEAGADADLAADLVGVRVVPPQITFSDRLILRRGALEIHLVHRPGVAPGALWVELPKEKIVFVGDAVVMDVPPLLQDANLTTWFEALAELHKPKFPATSVVPGRGLPTDKKGFKSFEDFLKTVRRKLEALQKAKKTRVEAGALADDLLSHFAVSNSLRDHYLRRLRVGLENLFDHHYVTPTPESRR